MFSQKLALLSFSLFFVLNALPACAQQNKQLRINEIQVIGTHNSYHAGQIALLRRQAGAWPPERGGDTW